MVGFEAGMQARLESTRLPPVTPGLDTRAQHRMWAGVGSLLVLRGFSLVTLCWFEFRGAAL